MFNEIVKKLKIGDKYTLVMMNDFGFASVHHITIKEGTIARSFAQYDDAMKLVFRKPRQKKDRMTFLYHKKTFAFYEGHVNLENDMYDVPEISNGCAIRKSKYMSCDIRNFTDIIDNTKMKPIIKNVHDW